MWKPKIDEEKLIQEWTHCGLSKQELLDCYETHLRCLFETIETEEKYFNEYRYSNDKLKKIFYGDIKGISENIRELITKQEEYDLLKEVLL